MTQYVKIIGANGQLSLGKAFAGKMVLIDQLDDGSWVIKPGNFIPDAEKWLYQTNNLAALEKGLAWAEKNQSVDNFEELATRLKNDQHQN